MHGNQQLTQTDASVLWEREREREWLTHTRIDPTLRNAGCHNVRSTVFWIISRTHGISQMESQLDVCFVTSEQAGKEIIIRRKVVILQCAQAESCFSCNKMRSVRGKYYCILLPDQHSLSVVISICCESASVSSSAAPVTCFGLGLKASCPHHQFRQCRRCGDVRLWGRCE